MRLFILDTTDPGAILAHATRLDPARTLSIVSTKSGGTIETLSGFKYFYNWTAAAVGTDRAGAHFCGITDPGSSLTTLAERYQFRTVFLNDPNIGGRYSALSFFGLVPAALVGVDLEMLLERALVTAQTCEPGNRLDEGENPGAWLGAILGELARAGRDRASPVPALRRLAIPASQLGFAHVQCQRPQGGRGRRETASLAATGGSAGSPGGRRDKVTFITSPQLANFGDWVEQLIAESTGKEGNGILPVVGEPLGPPDVYGDDRLFVHLRLEGDATCDAAVQALEGAGHPVVRLSLRDPYDLGGQFFLWELATAVTSHLLGINPFDQPNVEAAKVLARKMVAAYTATGRLPSDTPAPVTGAAFNEFLAQAQPGDYVALQAYLQPTAETDAALRTLRTRLRDHLKLATTVGYGPRFLHSTGQLYKGDAGNGLFVQFTADSPQVARGQPIPDEAGFAQSSMTFGVLIMAQALGDKQALLDAGRRVIRFHLGTDTLSGLNALARALA